MNKLLLVALATGMAIAAPVSGHAATVAVTAATSASTMLTGTSTFGDVTGSLSGSANAKLDLLTVSKSTKVQIVKVSTLKGYKAGIKMTAADLTSMSSLDAKVSANAALSAQLKAAGFAPNDVVAVSSDATGGMTVFVNK